MTSTNILYHVTPIENLEGIMQHGLQPGIGERSAALGETVSQVYLFDCILSCEDALNNWLGDAFEDLPENGLIVLEIDAEGLSIESGDAGYEKTCCDKIMADRIVRVLGEDFRTIVWPAPITLSMR